MSISEFNNATVRDTLIYIDEKIRWIKHQQDEQTAQANLNRINTFYLLRVAGAKLGSPSELYKLPNDIEEKKEISKEELIKLLEEKFN